MSLELSGLTKAYGEFEFGPVDLSVGREVLAVLGPSGSGKTTLLSLVAGIATPDSGSVALDGRELVGVPLEERRVGMVFQEGALFPHMTARENVAYAATDEARVAELADLLELEGVLDRRPATLSGGEAQRVALARTLAADPAALLLDEPLSSLDAPIRARLRDELHDLFASLAIPVLYVTHDQRTATTLGDRVAIVRDGALEQVGTPPAIVDRPASRFVARFTGNENLLPGAVADRDGDAFTVDVGGITLRATGSIPPGSGATVCVHPSRLELGPPGGAGDRDATVLDGTVVRRLNEGNGYRVEVEVGDGSPTVTATARPPTVERLGVETGSRVGVTVPPDAIHLIPDTEPADPESGGP